MNERKITTENFERDSLTAFEKMLQGYKKAKQSLAWESNMDDLIEKMTHLPTAPFPTQLMNLFDYNYLVLSEDISTLIEKALHIREQMEHTQRFVHIEETYFSLPFLPKNTFLKRLKVYNHEGELCYHLKGKLYIRFNKLLIWITPGKKEITIHDVFTIKQNTVQLRDLEIYYYSPFLDLTTTDPLCYYDFFCDYYGKTQFLKYFSTKDIISPAIDSALHNTPKALEEILKLSSSQQVLWAYFLFRLMGMKLRLHIDAAMMTRFLLIVNRNDLEDYRKSYFYKLVSKAPFVKEDKKLLADLETVRLHFQKSKLPTGDIDKEILNLITN
jgi:hypothetical protein